MFSNGAIVTEHDLYLYYEKKFYNTVGKVGTLILQGEEAQAAEIIKMYGDVHDFPNFGDVALLEHFYKLFKDNAILYDCIISVYSMHGYCFPKKIIMKAKQIAPEIPDSIRYNDLPRTKEVIVYRGTASTADQAKNEISWTTNKDIAVWFAYRYHEVNSDNLPDLHVYQGTINYDKIIAYYNGRSEFEVMQHRNVRNITEIFPTDEEIKDVFDRRQKDEP